MLKRVQVQNMNHVKASQSATGTQIVFLPIISVNFSFEEPTFLLISLNPSNSRRWGWCIYIWGGYIKRVRERERDLQTNFQKTVVLEATILIINTHMHEVFLINTFAFLLKNGIYCFDLV